MGCLASGEDSRVGEDENSAADTGNGGRRRDGSHEGSHRRVADDGLYYFNVAHVRVTTNTVLNSSRYTASIDAGVAGKVDVDLICFADGVTPRTPDPEARRARFRRPGLHRSGRVAPTSLRGAHDGFPRERNSYSR